MNLCSISLPAVPDGKVLVGSAVFFAGHVRGGHQSEGGMGFERTVRMGRLDIIIILRMDLYETAQR